MEIAHEYVSKRSSEKIVDDRVFSHYQPKGKKRNVREYLKSGEPEESYPAAPEVVEKPTEVEYRPIPEIDKKYLRT